MSVAFEAAASISDFHEFRSKRAAYTRTVRTTRLVRPRATRRGRLFFLTEVTPSIVVLLQTNGKGIGAGARTRTWTSLRREDFKAARKGRRIAVFPIRRPFPFPRSTRRVVESEGYRHPDGHLGSRLQPRATSR